MTISVGSDIEAAIDYQVTTGQFSSAEDVVSFGVRLLGSLDPSELEELLALRGQIRVGLQDYDEGRFAPLDIAAIIHEAERDIEAGRR